MKLNMNKKNKQSLMESGVWGRASEVQGQRWGNGGENKTENRQKEETERGREAGICK